MGSARRSGLAGYSLIVPLAMTAILHFFAGTRYGLFRDELYYISCANRLHWAYVDHPGFSVWLLAAARKLFGDGDAVVRNLSMVISLLSILAIGQLTRVMGGSSRAVLLAGLAVAAAPVFRVTGLFYSPNTLELLIWTAVILAWRKCMDSNSSWGSWLLFGFLFGIAENNRLSAAWLLMALVVATVVERPKLRLLNVVLAAFVSGLMMVPWVIWQMNHQWATLEFLKNANLHKLMPVPGWQFALTQIVVMGVLSLPVWAGGVVVGLRDRKLRPYAFAFLTVAAILLLIGRSRENYLSPAYAFILPIGAIWFEEWLGRGFKVYVFSLAATGTAFALLCMPILDPPVLALILSKFPQPPTTEKGPKSTLQGLSDTIGWRHLVMNTWRMWNQLPEETKRHTVILTANYGEASAFERFGHEFHLPPPICLHNQFWLWGSKNWDGKSALLVGDFPDRVLRQFGKVEVLGRNDDTWSTPEEGSALLRLGTQGHVKWRDIKRYE